MSDIARMIDAVIREGLAPALKEDGYKKTGRNFYKVSKQVIRLVNVQASQWNYGTSGKFTINLAVYLPEVARLTRDKYRGKGLPKEYDCTGSVRIGKLMPKRLDHWWEITGKADTGELAKDVAKAWQKYGKPWLDKPWEDLRVARELLLKIYRVSALSPLAASVLIDDFDWARRQLKRFIKTMNAQGTEWLIKRAKKLGIAVE